MRLIGTFKDQKQAHNLSQYLDNQGIENQLEVEVNNDWGSTHYGETTCRLWVIEEDQLELALEKMKEFQNNPQLALQNAPLPIKKNWLKEPLKEKIKDAPLKMIREKKLQKTAQQGFGPVTNMILILCTLLLVLATLTMPTYKNLPENLPHNVLLTPKVNKWLMFDYPAAYTIMDKIVSAYGIESLTSEIPPSPEEQLLIQTFNKTPYWKGFYEKIVNYFTKGEPIWPLGAPLFEKIREGEVWRLVTPIFLHYDIFHLFFNMIWLIVLGKQMEERLGAGRYILFILIAAVISNTLQYLMSGPNFLGFSGVLCAMITFVWIRQKKAAWEGYQLQSSTFVFIMIFILAMFGIQLLSFFLETYAGTSLALGIANTAHLIGALVGIILGYLDFFAYKNRLA